MSYNRLKILPILVFVALLSFSVRLAEFSVGVHDLSGGAFAADVASDHDTADDGDQEAEMQLAAAESAMRDKADMEATDKHAEANDNDEEEESIKVWEDGSDVNTEIPKLKMEMYEDLLKRRKDLEKKERTLVTREALLRAAEQELERKYQEMAALRAEIQNLLVEQTEEERKRIESLVKIYEGMKAKEAARIFDTLDLDVLVNVMSRMAERKIAPILAAMLPERARTVTIMLAEQKSLPELPEH